MRPYIYKAAIDRAVEERRRMEGNGEMSQAAKLDDLLRQLQETIRKATHGILGMDDEGELICGCCGKRLTPEAALAINQRLRDEGLQDAEDDDLGDVPGEGEGAGGR